MSNPRAPSYDDNKILVPMQLSAYLNYQSATPQAFNPPRSTRQAYLSAIPIPSVPEQSQVTELLAHDIFEDIKSPVYGDTGDRARRDPSRTGIYLHWALPKVYRQGIAASSTGTTDAAAAKTQAGFDGSTSKSVPSDSTLPQFRTIPDRWIVSRIVTPLSPSKETRIRRLHPSFTSGYDERAWVPPTVGSDASQLFLVESNIVRENGDFYPTSDIYNISTPMPDPNSGSGSSQIKLVGRSLQVNKWKNLDTRDKFPYAAGMTALHQGNPFWLDYQCSNSSVFSFYDNLLCPDQYNFGNFAYSQANVSYTVIGWHSNNVEDPAYLAQGSGQLLADRLSALGWGMNGTQDAAMMQRLADASKNARTILHGQFSNIQWNFSAYPNYADSLIPAINLTFPADVVQQSFSTSHPVAVSTDVIDALMAYINGQPSTTNTTAQGLASQLQRLRSYVMDVNTESLDSQLQADDLIATNNHVHSNPSTYWVLDIPATQPPPKDSSPQAQYDGPGRPSRSDIAAMDQLNQAQRQLDALNRYLQSLRRLLFDAYWTFVFDYSEHNDPATNADWLGKYKTAVTNIKQRISATQTLITQCQQTVTQKSALPFAFPLRKVAVKPFYMQADPLVLIAGANSQYSQDPSAMLSVRTDGQQIIEPKSSSSPPQVPMSLWQTAPNNYNFRDFCNVWPNGTPIDRTVIPAMTRLLTEGSYIAVDPRFNPASASSQTFAQFALDKFTGANGWFPLFVEYEVEYYHIPFSQWNFQPCGPESRISYCIKDGFDVATSDIQGDVRKITGRATIVPHASSALRAVLQQVFDHMPPQVLNATLNADARAQLLADVAKLDYLSCRMTGFTDQLLTRLGGVHFTPITYQNGEAVVAQQAKTDGALIGMTEADFLDIAAGNVMGTTPFASLQRISADPTKYSPFKATTNGQFRFTKLNIVDRFGQLVQAMQPSFDYSKGGILPAPLFPCIGDHYSLSPRAVGSATVANAVLPRTDENNPFVQVPPTINQPVRLNCDYLLTEGSFARPIEQWENPILGWLCLNFANQSLQVFDPAGEFVREYAEGTNGKMTTRPFGADVSTYATLPAETKGLLVAIDGVEGYLTRLLAVLTRASESIEESPSNWAARTSAILGRPIALTTFGISLELAEPPLQNRSTIAPTVGSAQADVSDISTYKFPMKIGDKDNVFDGLYGYFTSSSESNKKAYNMSQMYSYHDTDQNNVPDYTTLSPFWADTAQQYYDGAVWGKYRRFLALVDPFTAVHVYSAMLPINADLKFSAFQLGLGLDRIASFFKAGPIISPAPLPAFDPSNAVTRDYSLNPDDSAKAGNIPKQVGSIQVPSLSSGDWAWLQPFSDGSSGTQYNVLGIDKVAMEVTDGEAPYTVTEGYLQMRRPFSAAASAVARQ